MPLSSLQNPTAENRWTAAIANQQMHGDTVFPCVVSCQESCEAAADAADWSGQNRAELLKLATRHGAVLFRDFPLATAEDFDAFLAALDLTNFPYRKSLSNAVRVNRTERVFSANEAPPQVQIFFHHEMAQTPLFPRYILFFCEVAAEEGGATPICRSDVLYDRLANRCPEFIRDCETKGLRYTSVMPAADDPQSGMGRSWQSTLGVSSRKDAEARLAELGYLWQWLADDCLKVTTPTLPAVMQVAPGRKTFFNQLIAAYCGWKDSRNDPSDAIRHGDGSRLDGASVMQAVELANELAFDIPWKPGDVALLDNRVAMHARRPFCGTRKILASLLDPSSHAFSAT